MSLAVAGTRLGLMKSSSIQGETMASTEAEAAMYHRVLPTRITAVLLVTLLLCPGCVVPRRA